MFNPLHDEILAMINRNLKRYVPSQEVGMFTGGTESDISNPYTPKEPPAVNDREDNLLDGYDYQLLYNEDDDLIGFTSHNGKVIYTLNKDIYEDLISVSVQSTFINFTIGLIFENYDMRVDNEYVDDKGKLIEVVILDKVDNRFELVIEPLFRKVELGSKVQFTAYAVYSDGTKVDVTNQAEWSITSPSTIENGMATITKSGTSTVTAVYNNEIASADLLAEEVNTEDVFELNTVEVSWFLRDISRFDNDTVDIYINNTLIFQDFVFTTEGEWKDVTLQSGSNIIRFEAKNTDSGPITGAVSIFKRDRITSAVEGDSNNFDITINTPELGTQSPPYAFVQYKLICP